uniref:Putative secreted protein n=1 Tax=Ixodes ricinus TaxID=34613 RepID=A0A6B0VAB0_IXORI
MGQYQMSHVWMVVCATSLAKSKLVACEELKVKGRKCLVVDPESKEVKLRLLWLPPHMENRRVAEALEPFGTVRSIVREKWKCEGMEDMDTLNREVQLTLRDDVSVSKIPHLLTIYGCQSLLLIPGRPTLCLRCNRVGHIRRHCRTPRCTKCQRYGHSLADCVLTYADRLRIGTAGDSTTEHLMDASEVVEPSGDIPMMTEPPGPTSQPPPTEPTLPEGALPSPDVSADQPGSPPTIQGKTTTSYTTEYGQTSTDDQQNTAITEVEEKGNSTQGIDDADDPILAIEALTNATLSDGTTTRSKLTDRRQAGTRHKPYLKPSSGPKLVEDKTLSDNAQP